MSKEKGLSSEPFIKAFMKSKIASDLDKDFHHLQWAGKEYIMERILDELGDQLIYGEEQYDIETLYWIGYLYRSWHYYTGETSKDIYKQAPAKILERSFMIYHTFSIELAIERLKESYTSKHRI